MKIIKTSKQLLDFLENISGDVTFHAIGEFTSDIHLSAMKELAADLTPKSQSDIIARMTAQFAAHRAVGNQEQDIQNGKIAGYCAVCQIPWPCEYTEPR